MTKNNLLRIIRKSKNIFFDFLNKHLISKLYFSFIKDLLNKDKEIEKKLNKLIKENKFAAGYVPYISGRTEINIYNFFSINYGIRSKFDLIVAFTDHNFKSLFSIYKELNSRDILSISSREIDSHNSKNQKISFCIILLLNKRMKSNHAGMVGGHLRYWANYDNFSCYVHSLPLTNIFQNKVFKLIQKLKFNKIGHLHERRYYPESADLALHYGVGADTIVIPKRGDLSNELIAPFGFSLIKQKNSVRAIYHNTTFNRSDRFNNSYNNIIHGVAIPPHIECDLEMYFGEACSERSQFNVFLWEKDLKSKNIKILEKVEISIDDIKKPILLSNLFEIKNKASSHYWLTFKPISGLHDKSYINIFYKSKNNQIFDNVHSHDFRKNNRNNSFSQRALKFCPFKLNLSKEFYPILALWSGKDKSVEARLRIFCSGKNNFENIFKLNLPREEIIYINLKEYMDKDLEVNKDTIFIAQIECDELNINASMFNIKLNKDNLQSIAVDHLTGG
tara:strand:+ start:3462 stop:4976 length:1515 start_codon:yes stop_codon:yes gene_type:complete